MVRRAVGHAPRLINGAIKKCVAKAGAKATTREKKKKKNKCAVHGRETDHLEKLGGPEAHK